MTTRWAAIQLTLLVLSPALNTITLRNDKGLHIGALLAAITLSLALLASAWPVLAQSQHRWYRSRALAESMKALAWKYTMRARGFTDDERARDELLWRMTDILRITREVTVPPNGSDPLGLSAKMGYLRQASLDERRAAYLFGRLDPQCAWYSDRARSAVVLGRRWLAVALLTMLAGLTGSFLYALGMWSVNVLDVAAAVAASVIAWAKLRQFQPLADVYAVTAQELALVRTRIRAGTASEEQWADLCEEAENIISREHAMWNARKGEQ